MLVDEGRGTGEEGECCTVCKVREIDFAFAGADSGTASCLGRDCWSARSVGSCANDEWKMRKLLRQRRRQGGQREGGNGAEAGERNCEILVEIIIN